ncbi:cupin domain-containing protein [bacterium]|nr:cupin domain-containing protein [bacterium]
MKTASLSSNIQYNSDKPNIERLLDTPFSKEIRIVFKAGQIMKEHTAPAPIVVEMFEGALDFGVEGKVHHLVKGDMLTLDAKVPHDLKATEDSIVRLTLSKSDSLDRVFKVVR